MLILLGCFRLEKFHRAHFFVTGGLSTTAMIKIQVTDINDNRPSFYPREYNVSLREGGTSSSATTPVVIVAATDPDSSRFGSVTYRIVAGNEAGLFRIDRNTGEIFISRPSLLSTRNQRYHRLNISASDGGGLKSLNDAEVFISVIDSAQRPPIFEHARYSFSVKEDVRPDTIVGSVKATVSDSGKLCSSYTKMKGQHFRAMSKLSLWRNSQRPQHKLKLNKNVRRFLSVNKARRSF